MAHSQSTTPDSCAFYGDRPIYPYYHPSQPACKKDFYQLKKQFQEICNQSKISDGIITISFVINYKGEVGLFKSTYLDLNYKHQEKTNEIITLSNSLIQYIKLLGLWIPSKDDNGVSVNSSKFYSFKFINNKLSEVLPK